MTIYNSSDIKAGVPAKSGVYGSKNVGVITVASNVTLGSGTPDVLNICSIPNYAYIANFVLNLPALGTSLVMSLQDSFTTTTTYVATFTTGAAGGVVSILNFAIGTLGTQYGGTAVSIGGAPGTPEAVWATGGLLQLKVTTSASATTGASAVNIVYIVEWAPTYQAT